MELRSTLEMIIIKPKSRMPCRSAAAENKPLPLGSVTAQRIELGVDVTLPLQQACTQRSPAHRMGAGGY